MGIVLGIDKGEAPLRTTLAAGPLVVFDDAVALKGEGTLGGTLGMTAARAWVELDVGVGLFDGAGVETPIVGGRCRRGGWGRRACGLKCD